MARRSTVRVATRRGLGVAFLVLLLAFGGVVYAGFTKAFTPVDHVTLHASHIGLQLNKRADVKLRGLIVGEVREIGTDEGGGARLELAMEPDKVDVIPRNVTARILPKTLFGEKYVELVPPKNPSGSLSEGSVIAADSSKVGTELESVLDDVHPLLRTVKPEKLNATLSAMSTALEGRGDRVGDNLVRLNDYLRELEPYVPTLTDDLAELSDVSDIYRESTPDLVRLLENATETGNTVVVKERVLADFLTDLTTASATTRQFLDQNEHGLIRVGEVARPSLELLAEYSPEYACLLDAMAGWVPRMEDAFGKGDHFDGSAPALHIDLELVPQRAAYDRHDRPAFLDDRGPGCRTLPNPPYDQDNPAPLAGIRTGVTNDPGAGSRLPPGTSEQQEQRRDERSRDERSRDELGQPGQPDRDPPRTPADEVLFGTSSGPAGTAAEQRVVDALLGPVYGGDPAQVPDLATLLFGPMARGTEVNLR